jgi:hypothetical protein
VTSVDAQSLVLLQSTHDDLTSSSQLLSQPEQERGKVFDGPVAWTFVGIHKCSCMHGWTLMVKKYN